MNSDQIKLAIEIAKVHSISKAAENLYLSQPNASYMLASLEKELGYRLFNRGGKGAELTERGIAFMRYASIIKRSLDNIGTLGSESPRQFFSVASYQYDFALESFSELCSRHADDGESISFSFLTIDNIDAAMEMLNDGKINAAMCICREAIYDYTEGRLRSRGIRAVELFHRPLVITCNSEHPVAQKYQEQQVIDYDLLMRYPCIYSISSDSSVNYATGMMTEHLPMLKTAIAMPPGDQRYALASEINGYIISAPTDVAVLERRGLNVIEIPGSAIRFFVIYCQENESDPILKEWIRILSRHDEKK